MSKQWGVIDLDNVGEKGPSRLTEQLHFTKFFKRFMSTRKHHKDKDENGVSKPARYHTLATFRTALSNYYHRIHRKYLPSPVLLDLKTFYRGKKKQDHKAVYDGEITARVGKDSLSVELYEQLVWYFLQKGDIFA